MSTPRIALQARKKPYKKNLVAVGLVLLALGVYTIYDSSSLSYYHSTFNLLPSKFFKITDNLKDSATVKGTVKETGGRTISFLIMSSTQFAQYQVGQSNQSLYKILNVASGTVSFTFPTADSYFLLFLHGSGYLNTTETVDFQRTYLALARFEFFSGIVLVGLAMLLLYWGLRPKDLARLRGQPNPSETFVGQSQPARA